MNHIENLIKRFPELTEEKNNITEICNIIEQMALKDKKVLICGNGGSAADADHIVGELMKEFYIKRPISDESKNKIMAVDDNPDELIGELAEAVQAIALTAHGALSTALLNDCNPNMVFAQQVYGYGREGDVLIGLSTSGNSKNVVNAVRVAKAMGLTTIFIGGESGGQLSEIADVSICLPQKETYLVQELTLPLYHTICLEVEQRLFGQ